jgi:hypothetical protein
MGFIKTTKETKRNRSRNVVAIVRWEPYKRRSSDWDGGSVQADDD